MPMGVTEHMAYDGVGQVLLHTNVRGVQEGSTYDVAGRVVRTTVSGAQTAARIYADVAGADGLWTTREQDGNGNLSPQALGGPPLLLTFSADDADAVGRAMVAHGATVVIEIADRY